MTKMKKYRVSVENVFGSMKGEPAATLMQAAQLRCGLPLCSRLTRPRLAPSRNVCLHDVLAKTQNQAVRNGRHYPSRIVSLQLC
jgi:hypothetical protein